MNLVAQLFGEENLARFRNLSALRWDSGSWTYGMLCGRINAATRLLRARGLSQDDRIVFICSDTPVFVAAYFAAMNLGAAAIAVSTRSGAEELTHACRDSSAKAVIHDGGMAGVCDRARSLSELDFISIEISELAIPPSAADGSESLLETCNRGPEDESLWVYSSGSTSSPKGIVHTHKDIGRSDWLHTDYLKLREGDLIFCTSKISFAYALANGLIAPLRLGACVFLHPDWITLGAVSKIIKRYAFKAVFSVPTIYRHLLAEHEHASFEELKRPDSYVSAGEHLPDQIQRRWLKATGVPIINAYGCSETLFLGFAGDGRTTPDGSVGRPMPDADTELLKDDEVVDNESAEAGVLRIRHPYVFSYYANRAVNTEQRLNDGWFNTGDLFSRDSRGNWYHEGREDELIKVSGRWVSLRAIEKACIDSELSVESAVVSAPDTDGSIRAALFFVPSDSNELEAATEKMRTFMRSRLDRLVQPSWVRAIARMPRTQNGKIKRHSLEKIVSGSQRDAI